MTIGISIVVLRGNNLEIKEGLGFFFKYIIIKPPVKSSPNDKILSLFKRGAIYILNSTHKSLNHYFVIIWEALQFEAAVPQLRTFHIDLHPPTHVQLKIPTIDV